MFAIAECTHHQLPEVAHLNRVVQSLHAHAHPDLFKSEIALDDLVQEFAALLLEPNHRIFIALHAERVVGYAWCFYHERAEKILTPAGASLIVNHICVAPEFAHKGVGSQLLQRVEQWARALGVTRVSLDVWAFNESAAQFFLKTGYETYNIKMWKNL